MIYGTTVQCTPIEKGWSGDRKYRAVTADGSVYLLRISPADRYERRNKEFERMCQVAALGIPMCQPVEFGLCEQGAYRLESFIDGVDAEAYIPTLPLDRQYAYGLEAGRILKKIHTLPAPENAADWKKRYGSKIDKKLSMYEKCPVKYDNDSPILTFIAENRHLLQGRPQSYQHGDYHIGNMMVDRQGQLIVIDFDRDDHGDPWEEFNRIVWCAQAAPRFASGMADGYFGGKVPMEFWALLALYIAVNCLGSLPWAVPFGEKEIKVMKKQTQDVLSWYGGFQTVIPNWYKGLTQD